MEFSHRGPATDDAGDGHRFPDPPPHGNDADSPQADMVALVFRREQLVHELHKERIRHDMILCELAETERAMTACLAGRGALRGLPLMTPREEAMYRPPRSSEETSWLYRCPSGPVIPPVYPHVERSSSPVPQPRPADDAEQQERGSSSRPLVVTPSAFPDAEQFRSLSKEPVVEEALVPAATNVVAKLAEPALLRKEMTIESHAAVDHEHEAGLKHRHAVQLMENGIQISEQLKRVAVGQESKAEAKDSHAVQLMESGIQISQQPKSVAIGQGSKAEAKDSHAVQLMESGIQISEQLKRAAVGQERKAEANGNHAVQLMENKIQRTEQPKRVVFGQEREAEVKDSHAVKLTENRIQRSEQPKREVFGQQHEAEEKDRHAVKLMEETGIRGSEQPKPSKPTMKDCIDERRQLPHQHALAGKEKSPFNEQKRLAFNEPNTQTTPSGVKRRPILGPVVRTPSPKRQKPLEEWNCALCQEYLTREEDLTQHKAGELHQLNLAKFRSTQALHTEAGSHLKGWSHQESAQTRHAGGGNEGGKHAADRRGTEDPRKEFVSRFLFCKLCKVQCTSEKVMQSHLAGKKHRENLQARH